MKILPKWCEPIWEDEDFSNCFKKEIINKGIPISILLISLIILLLHKLSKRKRKFNSVYQIASLDPNASNVIIQRNEELNNQLNNNNNNNQFNSRIKNIFNHHRSRRRRNKSINQRQQEHNINNNLNSSTALHVFRTENAVILNEVHRILDDKFSINNEFSSNNNNLMSYQAIEKLKRSLETIGSIIALSLSIFGKFSNYISILWFYLLILNFWSLFHKTSFFKHKAILFAILTIISLWNFRSILIQQNKNSKLEIVFNSLYLTTCILTLLPSLLFPFTSRLPMRLKVIKETIQSESLYSEARTAIPTPANRSPRNSISQENNNFNQSKDSSSSLNLIQSPETHASILSRALFDFVTMAMIKHYKVQFTLDAVPDLPLESHAASVVATYRSEDEKGKEKVSLNNQDSESTPLLSQQQQEENLFKSSNSSLSWRLTRHFGKLLLLQAFWASVEGFSTLTAPLALRLILGFIAERSKIQNTPFHMAILFCLILLIGGFIKTIAASQALFIGRKICIRSRAILIFEIVNKALRRRDTGGTNDENQEGSNETTTKNQSSSSSSTLENKRTTDGEVTNLVAVDVFRVSEIGAYLHFIFPLSPIQILLCTFFLVKLLGIAAWIGLIVLIIAIPLQTMAARIFANRQAKMLKATDQRLNLANEVLNCIKTVKFFAWEKPFEKKMKETRKKELKALKKRFYAWVGSYALYLSLPTMVTLITFYVHTIVLKRPLPPETAFTALALFNELRNPLDALPDMFVNVLSAIVSLKRIDKFLKEEETSKYQQLIPNQEQQQQYSNNNNDDEILGFSNATFTYSESDEEIKNGEAFCLKDIDIKFPRGELSIIAGPVGSGKTTLLLCLLGETRQLKGKTFMPCAVARPLIPIDPITGLSETLAYCPQSPWLLGATVKENILFGQPFNERRYRSVIHACALEPDLAILEYNDETEVGEKGTALSGGQKARVALARAIYSPAKYVLLDDILSAVDTHTAKHLYRHCLKGSLMKNRTVILVTHAVALCLPGAALAIALKNGKIQASGKPAEIQLTGIFDNEIAPSGTQTPKQTHDQEEIHPIIIEELDEETRANQIAELKAKQEKKALHANIETYGKGNVGLKAYKLYICSFATTLSGLTAFWIVYACFFASARSTDVLNAAWLRKWASTYENDSDKDNKRTKFYLTIYAILAGIYVLCSIGREVVALFGSLRASKLIYKRLLSTILQAKPQWFDRTPIGRIMNRLSKDVETIDQDITMSLVFFIDVCLQSLVILLVACFSLPIFTIFAIIIVLLYWVIGALYIVSSRDLKRLESVTRSPIFTLVGEVLSGAVVIRAYGDASRFTRHCLRLIDKTNRPFYMLWCENRWLAIRVDGLATITSFSIALFLVSEKRIDAALAGFTLSFAIQLINAVLWVMRMYTQLEINANSVERVDEYLSLESEKFGQGVIPSIDWPSRKGAVEVTDLSVRYSSELPLVLRNVSFKVEPGQKIGICGRTGSGKSSLALAMFRFLEAETGKIVVDGLDLSKVALEEIRARLTIIPQEAQLFSGTVRFNLDPFYHFDDATLWDALRRCKLVGSEESDAIAAKSDNNSTTVITSLDMIVEQGGKNFSAGQRQLIALARGLLKLRNSNIVLLDESTASLDSSSDAAVQKTIQSEMKDATLLVVAHRIRGIVGFDKILVLDAGQLMEFDKPSTLMRKQGSHFRELCIKSGEFDTLLQMADEADRLR